MNSSKNKFRIKEARTQAGLTQAELANKLGIKDSTLSGYENGKHDPKSDTLSMIARICGVTVDFLLGRHDAKNDPKALTVDYKPSEEALALARTYDNVLDDHGRLLLRTIAKLEGKRCAKRGPQKLKTIAITPDGRTVPVIETIDDAILYTRYLAKEELQELEGEQNAQSHLKNKE